MNEPIEEQFYPEPSDEDLFRALDQQLPLPQGHKEMGRLILPCSIEEYWSLFHDTGCRYGFDKYYEFRGYNKIQVSQDWTEEIQDPHLKSGWQASQKWKQINYVVDVQNNPFLKLTPTTKNYMVLDH